MIEKKEQIKTIGTGQLLYNLIRWIYDNPLYIVVISLYGPLIGGGIMTVGSFVICFFLMLWYNRCKIDWIGVNAVDSIKVLALHYTEKLAEWRMDSYLGKLLFITFFIPIRMILLVLKIANHRIYGDVIAFILLSILEDPFIVTAYLRHGNFGPMTHRDWVIFFASVVLSNGYWIMRTSIIIEVMHVLSNFF